MCDQTDIATRPSRRLGLAPRHAVRVKIGVEVRVGVREVVVDLQGMHPAPGAAANETRSCCELPRTTILARPSRLHRCIRASVGAIDSKSSRAALRGKGGGGGERKREREGDEREGGEREERERCAGYFLKKWVGVG